MNREIAPQKYISNRINLEEKHHLVLFERNHRYESVSSEIIPKADDTVHHPLGRLVLATIPQVLLPLPDSMRL